MRSVEYIRSFLSCRVPLCAPNGQHALSVLVSVRVRSPSRRSAASPCSVPLLGSRGLRSFGTFWALFDRLFDSCLNFALPPVSVRSPCVYNPQSTRRRPWDNVTVRYVYLQTM
jgi:hypothetical protein